MLVGDCITSPVCARNPIVVRGTDQHDGRAAVDAKRPDLFPIVAVRFQLRDISLKVMSKAKVHPMPAAP